MGLRVIYKDGKDFACGLTQAKKMVAEEGWSWTPDSKTSSDSDLPKPSQVKVEPEEIKVDSPFNDGEPVNQDLGETEDSESDLDSDHN